MSLGASSLSAAPSCPASFPLLPDDQTCVICSLGSAVQQRTSLNASMHGLDPVCKCERVPSDTLWWAEPRCQCCSLPSGGPVTLQCLNRPGKGTGNPWRLGAVLWERRVGHEPSPSHSGPLGPLGGGAWPGLGFSPRAPFYEDHVS